MTKLEVTTGALDAPSAPGNISKLQVKLLNPNNAGPTLNYNGLTGPVQTSTFGGLARHSKIQVQGNVRDIDPKRTDVVTVTERVNLRPDIAIQGIAAPDKVKPNTEIVVTATAAELNGDVGATSNCVLYVDGSEAKRINGMWIADGDEVTCAFKTTMGSAGTYTLDLRYAAGHDGPAANANRTATLTANGASQQMSLPPTTNWNTWTDSTVTVNLVAGTNRVTIGRPVVQVGVLSAKPLCVGLGSKIAPRP
jgi:hypothetical protein